MFFRLAKSTIDEIRNAERRAAEMISEAEAAARKKIEDTAIRVEADKKASVLSAQQRADGIIADARMQSETMADSARKEAQTVSAQIKETAAKNTDAAVLKVIEILG